MNISFVIKPPNLDMNNFYIADWQYLETEGPADMWFYSNYENMRNFGDVFNILSNDIKAGSPYETWAGGTDGGIVNSSFIFLLLF